jgi:hypothetical protein
LAESRKIVRVFLGSPGDLGEERRAAKAVVDEINEIIANRLGYLVELVRWENVVASFGRPQGTINKDLERCELFVGMMWKKWGTPPAKGGPYTSGFHEEYSISAKSCEKTGRPEISLYFKNVDPAQLEDPGSELKKVLEFKREVTESKSVMYEGFSDAGEFSQKLRRCITNYLFRLRDEEQKTITEESQTLPTERDGRGALAVAATADNTPLSREGAAFLRDFVARTETGGGDAVSTAEIARLRLLGGMLGQAGNDERSLGVHDANLLFMERKRIGWGQSELVGLVGAGCEHFVSENAPIWYWVEKLDGFSINSLPFFSLFGAADRVVGCLQAMRLIAEPLKIGDQLTREFYLKQWLERDTASPIRVAALEYLGECGQPSDLGAIRAELDRKNYQTSGAAIQAMLRIELRQSRSSAIKLLYELQADPVSADIVKAMFTDDASIPDETLVEGLAHKSTEVRRIASRLLARRGQLSSELAEPLLSDADASVRLEALTALAKIGRTYSVEAARDILVKPRPAGFFGGFGPSDPAGEKCLKRFRQRQFDMLRDAQLEEEAKDGFILNTDAHFALAERQFTKFGRDLRDAVRDNYRTAFDKALVALAATLGERGAATVQRVERLDEQFRKENTRAALNILCRNGSPTDLELIRATLRAGFVDPADADIEYLSKHGEWGDIPLIIVAAERAEGIASLFAIDDPIKYRNAARSIYHMGQKRFAEVVTLDMPSSFLARVIRLATGRVFRALRNSTLEELLHAVSPEVRKSTVLKCVLHLPRHRLVELLERHVSDGRPTYYNVVHWLDFGISVPRDRMLIAASMVLNRMS